MFAQQSENMQVAWVLTLAPHKLLRTSERKTQSEPSMTPQSEKKSKKSLRLALNKVKQCKN